MEENSQRDQNNMQGKEWYQKSYSLKSRHILLTIFLIPMLIGIVGILNVIGEPIDFRNGLTILIVLMPMIFFSVILLGIFSLFSMSKNKTISGLANNPKVTPYNTGLIKKIISIIGFGIIIIYFFKGTILIIFDIIFYFFTNY